MMTKGLAVELISDNVRVNNVALGYIQDRMTNGNCLNRKINHQWKDLIGTTVFLASKSSLNITGQSLFVVGDWTAMSRTSQTCIANEG